MTGEMGLFIALCDLEHVIKVIWVSVASWLKWISCVNTEILHSSLSTVSSPASYRDESFSFILWLILSLLTGFSNRIFLESQSATARRDIMNEKKKNISTVKVCSNTKVLTNTYGKERRIQIPVLHLESLFCLFCFQ